ncbi:unnamed protein product [Cylicostephanus goldi]|uniref:glucuronosyltransferase n=1 Tax=Cylicostephanus goldi TaxID=71465 RepID=A0A3P7PPS8_CYLGO|nr:unnamed protein product [Cylicostephanus goldi]
MRTCILLLLSLYVCYGYKFLVYSPIYGYSHTNFMGAIADTLTEAGHDVVISKGVITEEKLMKQLRDEKFDVGISEALGMCGFGVFELAQIPASIATLSIVHKETVAAMIGESVNPSYVPGPFSVSGDRMGFLDRIKNVLGVIVGETFFKGVFNGEEDAFRRIYGPQFKGHKQLIAESSYLMTNSNPYLDYPRPMLHKTVPIGGIAVSIDSKKNKLSKVSLKVFSAG